MTSSLTSENPLRLVNTQHQVMHNDHTESASSEFSDMISPNDPRWIFAARVQVVFNGTNRIRSMGQMNDLIECGAMLGFTNIHARAIVAIVEEAQLRNGLDEIAMDELMSIPKPETENELSDRTRWITFGMLFLWAFSIAGLMQLV